MVSQRSCGSRPPTLDEQTLDRLRRTPVEPPEFPRELSRCRCGTKSFLPDDHATGCPFGPTPPLSTSPRQSVTQLPEWQRGF
ncbi:hypothetical protein Mvan_3609 [Mycolicibacterium vanbaalenii PYR-1]|uniref:Uncharacterized protein n=1 Tax=Mycolicibacterium vanbaalenii (strain DSM 7251 / JCM 13017 / BCRC 16820 / KCTC 9966 / NRRL B-24157 / PYR-1) TaxID=350058 RepID=A1TB51_MYCVP|nr:hypothetical protein Mvan_3609 [Mycolicibacterium vanbaalenii PYR-1]